jgi:hypothetical protein
MASLMEVGGPTDGEEGGHGPDSFRGLNANWGRWQRGAGHLVGQYSGGLPWTL